MKSNEKIAGCGGNSSGFTNKQSPQSWAFSRDLLDPGIGGGDVGMVTND